MKIETPKSKKSLSFEWSWFLAWIPSFSDLSFPGSKLSRAVKESWHLLGLNFVWTFNRTPRSANKQSDEKWRLKLQNQGNLSSFEWSWFLAWIPSFLILSLPGSELSRAVFSKSVRESWRLVGLKLRVNFRQESYYGKWNVSLIL